MEKIQIYSGSLFHLESIVKEVRNLVEKFILLINIYIYIKKKEFLWILDLEELELNQNRGQTMIFTANNISIAPKSCKKLSKTASAKSTQVVTLKHPKRELKHPTKISYFPTSMHNLTWDFLDLQHFQDNKPPKFISKIHFLFP